MNRRAGWDDVVAVILAGGLGTRLRSVVADRPKCLAEVLGRPFLAHQLDRLAAAGIARALICTGYLGEQVEASIGPRHGPIEVAYSREQSPLGTGGGLRLGVSRTDRPFLLVVNGDSLCDAALAPLLERSVEVGGRPVMMLVQMPDTAAFGRVACADEAAGSRVTGFCEKGVAGPGWINAGIYLMARADVMGIAVGEPVSLERDVFPAWAAAGHLFSLRTTAGFIDIGTPETYHRLERFLLDRQPDPRLHGRQGAD